MDNRTKSLGQHFLYDKNIARKITSSLIQIHHKYNTLIEIGPGKGVLTDFIAQFKNINPYFIEIDKELITYLKNKFPLLANNFINTDILRFDFGLLKDENVGIIGNFPYNISSHIVMKIIENRKQVIEVVGMFQKEVAERIASKPGNKTYGILSVFTQAYYDTEYLFTVHNHLFTPKPKVDSAIIRLTRKDNYHLDCDEGLFRQIVKTTFNQRRKMIRNTLSAYPELFNHIDNTMADKRPEALSYEDFVYLTKIIEQHCS